MKNKIGLVVVALIFVTSSCNKDATPKNVLSKKELADIVVELYTAEARMAGMPIASDSSYKLFLPFEEAMFKKRGIPDSIMKITFRYYVEHPIELEQVYDIVVDTLSLREQKAGLKPKQ